MPANPVAAFVICAEIDAISWNMVLPINQPLIVFSPYLFIESSRNESCIVL